MIKLINGMLHATEQAEASSVLGNHNVYITEDKHNIYKHAINI